MDQFTGGATEQSFLDWLERHLADPVFKQALEQRPEVVVGWLTMDDKVFYGIGQTAEEALVNAAREARAGLYFQRRDWVKQQTWGIRDLLTPCPVWKDSQK